MGNGNVYRSFRSMKKNTINWLNGRSFDVKMGAGVLVYVVMGYFL